MITEWLDRKWYPTYTNNWDDVHFREVILNLIKPEYSCLDYGAGRGNVEHMNFKGLVKEMCGIDPGEEVISNPFLDDAKVLSLETNTIPYPDEKFDLIFSDNVMEHIEDTAVVFKEISRVLKTDGVFIAKTPNKWHYMPMIARITPVWFHKFYNGLRGRDGDDTFPTRYMCNTKKDVHRYADEIGLKVISVNFIEGRPEYLRINPITYLFGYIYERMVNNVPGLSKFRCVMVFELQKTE